MKTSIIGWLGVVIACAALAGCGDKRIAEVKALPFSYPSNNVPDPNMIVDQALDYRKVCDSVKWRVDQTEQHQTFVEYSCTYKSVKDSAFIAKSKWQQPTSIPVVSAGDVYQWIYGADGKPTLSYVAVHYQYANGTANDTYTGNASQATALMKEAVNNTAEDYDHLFSDLGGGSIPPPVAELVAQAAALKAKEDARIQNNCLDPWKEAYVARQTALGNDTSISQDQINEWLGWCKELKPAPVVPGDNAQEVQGSGGQFSSEDYKNFPPGDKKQPNARGVLYNLYHLPFFTNRNDPKFYPIYDVKCQFDKQVCEMTDVGGNPIQMSVQDVAAKLSYINNLDILAGKYRCRFAICTNSDGAIVGRASNDMVKFIPELGQ